MEASSSKQAGPPPTVPSVLLPEILSFSPHFLLDDIVNIANHAVGDTVDAMEKFILRWADERADADANWDSTQELEQGLVAFQTLLEFHTDIAFDFFEAWSLRNIFAIPADLPIVVPHHAGLDLEQPPGKEAELLAEIEDLRRQVDNVRLLRPFRIIRSVSPHPQERRLERLLTRAARIGSRQTEKSRRRYARLASLHPNNANPTTLNALPQDLVTLSTSSSALPDLELVPPDVPDPGKRHWEAGKAGYLGWAASRLIARAKEGERRQSGEEIVGKADYVKAALEVARAKSKST
ncbi:hypothetical protein EVG20_g3145 [Dentipellis fragilis]|uniref:Mis12-domain-containing protein n=1 Tax=Dentipellis fragilis TaxID=205917 RepID=A0A4Y9Z4W4_9AGAM|nr:hypothetical protein EVG20_g3145 [Dentipellis fragilis]